MESLVHHLKLDCRRHGRGRKAWWARRLGVPPLTLSHWLAGRQAPNADHGLAIRDTLDQMEHEFHHQPWKDYLWDCYYLSQTVPAKILPLVILEVLLSPGLDTRTLALLSRFVERESPNLLEPRSGLLHNKVGWLLEVSGVKPKFHPDKSAPIQMLGRFSSLSPQLKRHLARYQTAIGKKWRVHDCSMKELKGSLR